jgi:divalent metal cation (Fe/Co/Zn/Cd) transporter
MTDAIAGRLELVRRGRTLEYFTLAYNSVEALVSLIAGAMAGSVSLTGFGLDSLIEVASGAALLWRLNHDVHAHDVHPGGRGEVRDRIALRIVGCCFLALALYVAADSAAAFLRPEKPSRSLLGVAMAACSVVVMPLLARAKRRVATGIGSAALQADSRQADFCAWLSAIVLAGLLLNSLMGWWWADPIAALLMVPIIGKEGLDAIRGKACADCGCH